jgi:hypothetical protein
MVHPCLTGPLVLTLSGIGTAVALIILGTVPKFRGGILGKIMGQTLQIQSHPKTAAHHKVAVMGYGFEMLPGFHNAPPPLLDFIIGDGQNICNRFRKILMNI